METYAIHLKRLIYLRDRVLPHLDGMPTIEDVVEQMSFSNFRDDYEGIDASIEVDYDTERVETFESNRKKKQGRAILNFNTYNANHTPVGFDHLPATKRYDCSREGCLAGWYVFLREEDDQMGETMGIMHYNIRALRDHFGILLGEAQLLFGSTLKGAEGLPDEIPQEDTIWSTSQMNITKLALAARAKYLDDLIEKYENPGMDAELSGYCETLTPRA